MPTTRTSISFVGGAAIGFEVRRDVLEAIGQAFVFAVRPTTAGRPTVTYRQRAGAGGTTLFERHDDRRDPAIAVVGNRVDDVVDDLHLSIALHATDDVFVHAGAVAWNDVAIVLPGRSHVGKSTLVDALVRAGAVYLSDEYARITDAGWIAPYPRPIHLRTSNGRRLVEPSSIGEVADRSYPPGLIVFAHHVATSVFDPRPVSPAQAALDLFDNTVIAEQHPLRATAAVARVARRAAAARSPRPDVTDAAQKILSLADKMGAAP